MRGHKNKILKAGLQRVEGDQHVGAAAADAVTPTSWWRSMMQGLGSRRRRQALATMQRLAHHDVEDTISEADIQGWLTMLESQSGGRRSGARNSASRGPGSHKPDTKAAPPAQRRTDRR